MSTQPRSYRVLARDREPLLAFIVDALRESGCQIISCSPPTEAPFKLSFETPSGERIGVVAYAFRANSVVTRNRPADECRFQVKYGTKDGELHEIWQDSAGLYVTLFLGIDPERGIFVGADPVLHNPTKFFISVEFKEEHAQKCQERGWWTWERDHRKTDSTPVEVLVGGTASSLLRYIRYEREALGEDQGHRQLLAERFSCSEQTSLTLPAISTEIQMSISSVRVHELAREFEMDETQVLDLIQTARRLKMAVRGWVAEVHLVSRLCQVPGVTECRRIDDEGGPDVRLRFEGGRPLNIECKNVLRKVAADGSARIDFQRTRVSKSDPCSRFYDATDFDLVAACLHAVTERWEFKFAQTGLMDHHETCRNKLSNRVKIDARWHNDVATILRAAGAA